MMWKNHQCVNSTSDAAMFFYWAADMGFTSFLELQLTTLIIIDESLDYLVFKMTGNSGKMAITRL